MATSFKHLEILPLDETNLIVNDNPESNLQSKACINLAFNALNSTNRLININNINSASSNNTISFLNLSYNLESLLTTLLTVNTISNIDNTQLSSHYLKRQSNINANKILPSFSYCQNLTFTRFKNWAGLYGTLSYYINLLEQYDEYLTPSQIVHEASKSLFQYCKQVIFNSQILNNLSRDLLLTYYDQAINLLDNDSIEADKQIYNLSINIILSHPLIRQTYNELNFYKVWLKKVFEWKQKLTSNNSVLTIIDNPSSNTDRANNTLINCINIFNQSGFDINTLNSINKKFIFQEHSNNLQELISSLAEERRNSTFIKIDGNNNTLAEELTIEFLDNISKFRQNLDFNNASNIIQETFCPPAGYCLILVTAASNLINRAYILSYNNINNNEDLETSEVYKRIQRLLGLASILLIKTGNPTIQILGQNTLKTFKLYITDIDIINLLDNYK